MINRRAVSRLTMRATKEGEIRVSAPLWVPRRQIMAFIENNREWMTRAVDERTRQAERTKAFFSKLPLSSRAEKDAAKALLDEKIRPLLAQHCASMKVMPASITYKATRSRWGSCKTATGEISLSLYLLLLPDCCIEHTLVHELAHLIVPNHSPAFYAVMDAEFPEWKKARTIARKAFKSEI
ncbi:MAG: DUF45 domain-containing protein [Bacteroidales bacterium]|nr:DUF45 domain-containing protein [Bacteroidales bacterium]